MRRYRLEIFDAEGKPPRASDGTPIGPFDTTETPGRGLHIVFDALIAGYDVISSGTMISIFGLPITMLSQSVKLNGYQLNLYAGFSAGLPLANPDQAGLIISGQIYNPYANWEGTHQSMNLIVNPSPLLNDKGQATSITLDGKKGEKLSTVLLRGLATAYPKFTLDISISDRLVWSEDAPGFYPRLGPMATMLRGQSIAMINDESYSGIQTVMQNNVIRIFDNFTLPEAGGNQILPQELIGQPTWIGLNTVSFKCPLRYDLHCGDVIELPTNIISGPTSILSVNTERSFSMYRNNVNFSGKYQINSVRHVGQYLSPDSSNAWVTIYEAFVLGKQ
ncbi:hypothetical protein ERD95_17550 [Enterobacteriaceae bacterium ML5]|nr:hypothetical protein ERD95_17550 [Enterobacteriaceae bacterium ML5]